MYSLRNCLKASLWFASAVFAPLLLAADTALYAHGVPATAEQIAAWDIDVRPDGQGLPLASGSVLAGEPLYEEMCASCHGSFGEGVGAYPAIAGGDGSLTDPRPRKTVGSYWPYASTLWDYLHRAMPFRHPASLSDDDVYAITAYVLYLNDIVDDGFVLSQENLPHLRMPNQNNFIADPRPDTRNTRCMEACKDPAKIQVASQASAFVPAAVSVAALEPASGSIARGREIAADRDLGNCYSCHAMDGAEMAGNAGPPLIQMRLRFPERAQLKAQIVDPRTRNPHTLMPPYGAHGILSDDEIERVVDYVYSL